MLIVELSIVVKKKCSKSNNICGPEKGRFLYDDDDDDEVEHWINNFIC